LDCYLCPLGTISTAERITCDPCTAGKFTNDSETCYSCDPGAEVKNNVCTACSNGTYSLSGFSCDKCPIGKYSKSGFSICTSCESGRYNSIEGLSTCYKCSSGEEARNGIVCIQCGPGTFSTPGEICTPCSKGKYSNLQRSDCLSCDPGFFSSSQGQSNCTACPFGNIASISGLEVCTVCPAGTFSTDGISCKSCGKNSISSSGSSSCTNCSIGYSTLDAITCTICESGKYWNFGSCLECPVGLFSSQGQTSCGCGIGYISERNKTSQNCSACSIGTYNDLLGSSVCQSCPSGTWSTLGSASCISTAVCTSTQCTNAIGISISALALISGATLWCSGAGVGTMIILLFASFELWGNIAYVFVESFLSRTLLVFYCIFAIHGVVSPVMYDIQKRKGFPFSLRYRSTKYLSSYFINPLVYVGRFFCLLRYIHLVILGVIFYCTKFIPTTFFRKLWFKTLLKSEVNPCNESIDRTVLFRCIYFENIYFSLPLFCIQVLHIHFYQHRTAFTMLKVILSAFFALRGILAYLYWMNYHKLSWEKLYPEGGRMSESFVLKILGQKVFDEPEIRFVPFSDEGDRRPFHPKSKENELANILSSPLKRDPNLKTRVQIPSSSIQVIQVAEPNAGESEGSEKKKPVALISVYVPTPEEIREQKKKLEELRLKEREKDMAGYDVI
jgi:hypothetical protein